MPVRYIITVVVTIAVVLYFHADRLEKSTANHVGQAVRHGVLLTKAGLSHKHCMPRSYDVEGAYERWLQNNLNIHSYKKMGKQ